MKKHIVLKKTQLALKFSRFDLGSFENKNVKKSTIASLVILTNLGSFSFYTNTYQDTCNHWSNCISSFAPIDALAFWPSEIVQESCHGFNA